MPVSKPTSSAYFSRTVSHKGQGDLVHVNNRLYYGDCLTSMRDYMKQGSVDLIYLDPPFNSNRTYNAISRDETG